jgi:hypothetical protein
MIGSSNKRKPATFSSLLSGAKKIKGRNPIDFGRRILLPVSFAKSPSTSIGGMGFYSNSLPAFYQITDSYGTTIYYLGTLCSDVLHRNIGMCDIDLQPGCYIFRVDGEFDSNIDDISWNFCGAKGGAQTQLTFCIDNNLQCKGIKVDTASDLCADMTTYLSTTTLSMTGTFDLGVNSEITSFTDKDVKVIREALIKEFNDASDSPNAQGNVELAKLSWNPSIINAEELNKQKQF